MTRPLVFIPYGGHDPDLFLEAYHSSENAGVEVIVLDNSSLCGLPVPLESVQRVVTQVTLHLPQLFNLAAQIAREKEAAYYIWQHSDAVAHSGTTSRLIEMAQSLQEKPWGALFTNYDCLCALNTEAVLSVGGANWRLFPFHYSWDWDIYNRLRLASYPLIESGLLVSHEMSHSLKADPVMTRAWSKYQPAAHQMIEELYPGGSQPVGIPFNQAPG